MPGSQTQMGFGGVSRVTSLPNGFSPPITGSGLSNGPAVTTLSGTTLAGTSNLKTLLNVSGSRLRLNTLSFLVADATVRDIRVVITVDGVVVFNSTVNCNAQQARVVVGLLTAGSGAGVAPQPVDAASSLKIEFGCSLAETDKLTFSYNYEVRG